MGLGLADSWGGTRWRTAATMLLDVERERAARHAAVLRVEVELTPEFRGARYRVTSGFLGGTYAPVAAGEPGPSFSEQPDVPGKALDVCDLLAGLQGAEVFDHLASRWVP